MTYNFLNTFTTNIFLNIDKETFFKKYEILFNGDNAISLRKEFDYLEGWFELTDSDSIYFDNKKLLYKKENESLVSKALYDLSFSVTHFNEV